MREDGSQGGAAYEENNAFCALSDPCRVACCLCVVLASDGYPVAYEKGFEIKGLENFENKDEYFAFHAGTKMKDGAVVTNGGRVLGVTAVGSDLKEARANAYKATEWIEFDNKYMRHDIGKAIDEA